MYVPPAFAVADEATLFDFIDAHGFATLVTTAGGGVPVATHLPLLLDRGRRVLVGHVARANPHWELIPAAAEALAIFTGPHGYVSPAWYETAPAVPTWNYTAVHVSGPVRLIEDPAELSAALDWLVRKYEAKSAAPWSGELPPDYREKMLRGIVGVEVAVGRVEGKFKLSQNRSAADRRGVIRHLEAGGDPAAAELASFMRRVLGGDGV